jgi:dTDP-4-dehydrorhamnose 3,5-epimerase-like enzyme
MPHSFGQIYFVTFDTAGQVRGNHYHENAYEAFGIVSGVLEVVLEDVRSHERFEVVLNSDDHLFTRLKIGPYVAHAFRNISPTAILLNYSTEQFNTVRPDRLDYLLIDAVGAERTLLANS